MTILFSSLDSFTRAYITTMLWTYDEDAPGGMDYRQTGRVTELYPKIADETVAEIVTECREFQEENASWLESAGSGEQNGHDFWLTRNNHGVGFWDRGYAAAIGDALTHAANRAGERDLYQGDDGRLYL